MLFETIRRRNRLKPHSMVSGRLIRYEDPETGALYVGLHRWDPCMVRSIINELREEA